MKTCLIVKQGDASKNSEVCRSLHIWSLESIFTHIQTHAHTHTHTQYQVVCKENIASTVFCINACSGLVNMHAQQNILEWLKKSYITHFLLPQEAFGQKNLTKAKKKRKCLFKRPYSLPQWPAKICPPAALLLFRRFTQLILSHYIFLLLRAAGSTLKKHCYCDSC